MKKSIMFSILILISLILSMSISQSKEIENKIYVNDDGTEEYTSIQEAINNVSHNSSIYVKNGEYIEDIYVNKTLSLIGEDNNYTNISGCFHVIADMVTITNFKIDSSKNIDKTLDYGIEIRSNSSTIKNNIITNNKIGIGIYDFNNSIYHNNFINNTKQGKDSGNNTWFNKKLQQGNYWDDYNGSDTDNDGIGNNPYNITESGVQDSYPLMMPYDEFININKRGFNLDELAYVLTIGVILSVVFLVPIAYYFRKKILKL